MIGLINDQHEGHDHANDATDDKDDDDDDYDDADGDDHDNDDGDNVDGAGDDLLVIYRTILISYGIQIWHDGRLMHSIIICP